MKVFKIIVKSIFVAGVIFLLTFLVLASENHKTFTEQLKSLVPQKEKTTDEEKKEEVVKVSEDMTQITINTNKLKD